MTPKQTKKIVELAESMGYERQWDWKNIVTSKRGPSFDKYIHTEFALIKKWLWEKYEMNVGIVYDHVENEFSPFIMWNKTRFDDIKYVESPLEAEINGIKKGIKYLYNHK